MLLYVWDRIYERTNYNLSVIFKKLDTRGKGKLRKKDFLEGLHRFNVDLSSADLETVWNVLDCEKKGYIRFKEFRRLQEEEDRPGIMEDPYKQMRLESQVH